jgi:hypothetical protein
MAMAAVLGGFIGELLNEVDNKTHVIASRFIAYFLANAFLGFIVAVLIKEFIIKKNVLVASTVGSFVGFLGHKKGLEIISPLISRLLPDVKIDDKEERT